MIYKKISFSLLDKIEKNKIEKIIIKIKSLYLNQEKCNKQLTILLNYKKEYIKQLDKEMILGISLHKWKNYNNFISILHVIIKNNKKIIKKNQNEIENKLNEWSKNQKTSQIWQIFNLKNKKNLLKIKKIQEQIVSDEYIQLKILNKEYSR